MNLYPPGVWFADARSSFSGVAFVLFCFVLVFLLSLKPRPFAQSFFDIHAPRHPHAVTQQLSASFFVFVSSFFLFLWGYRFFPSIFVSLPFLFCMEGISLPDSVFVPFDHELDFLL